MPATLSTGASSHGGPLRTRRLRQAALLAACAALLVACSARKIAYGLAPTFILSAIDSAVSLDRSQKDRLRPRLRELLAWHRHEELPRYASRLDELRARLRDGLSQQDIEWTRTTVEEIQERLVRRAAPIAGELLATLTPAQLDRLDHVREVERAKRDKEGRLPLEKALAKETAKDVDALEKWSGRLTPEQRAMLAAHRRRTHGDTLARHETWARLQSEFLRFLRSAPHPPGEVAAAVVDALVAHGAESREPADRERLARLLGAGDELALTLFQTTTPKQRQRLDRELASLRDDMLELAQDE